MFLAFFPDLADDSYATIGLEGPASTSALPVQLIPSLVEDSALRGKSHGVLHRWWFRAQRKHAYWVVLGTC